MGTSAVESLRNLCMAGAFHSFFKCVCLFFEVSYKMISYMLFFTVGHYKLDAWHKCYCLLAIIMLDWMPVLLIEDMQEHVQTFSERSCACLMSGNREINSIQMLFDQASGVCLWNVWFVVLVTVSVRCGLPGYDALYFGWCVNIFEEPVARTFGGGDSQFS